jgi:hypothetical protein
LDEKRRFAEVVKRLIAALDAGDMDQYAAASVRR